MSIRVHVEISAHVSICIALHSYAYVDFYIIYNNFYKIYNILFLFTGGCPCDGCDTCWNCEDEITETCRDPSLNENVTGCRKIANDKQVHCAQKCMDIECYDACWNLYQIDINNCPCGVNCKGNKYWCRCFLNWPLVGTI